MLNTKLAILLHDNNMSPEQLAAKINVNKSEINSYLAGVEADLTTLRSIAEVFKVPVKELCDLSFGSELRELRKEENLTIKELSEMSGLNPKILTYLENGGSRAPTKATRDALRSVYGEKFEELESRYADTFKLNRDKITKKASTPEEERRWKEIGANLKKAVKDSGMTHRDFMKAVGISPATYDRITRLGYFPLVDLQNKICNVLRLPQAEIFPTAEQPEPVRVAEMETAKAKIEPQKTEAPKFLEYLSYLDDKDFRIAVNAMFGAEVETNPQVDLILRIIKDKKVG